MDSEYSSNLELPFHEDEEGLGKAGGGTVPPDTFRWATTFGGATDHFWRGDRPLFERRQATFGRATTSGGATTFEGATDHFGLLLVEADVHIRERYRSLDNAFRVWGLEFGFWVLGFGVWGLGSGV